MRCSCHEVDFPNGIFPGWEVVGVLSSKNCPGETVRWESFWGRGESSGHMNFLKQAFSSEKVLVVLYFQKQK